VLYSLAATLSLFSGLVLFGLGTLGLVGMSQEDMHPITVLLHPSGLGDGLDRVYYGFLVFLGCWLTLCLYVRVPATIALALVLSKVSYLGDSSKIGMLPALALSLTLAALLLRMITTTSWLKRDKSKRLEDSIW